MSSSSLYGAQLHANGIRQHVLRFGGKGQPVILVPGITSPAAVWSFVADRLGLTHDVYVLDVRGRGLSESGRGLDYRLDACADDVTAVILALDLGQPIGIGHSMGGRHLIRAVRRGAPLCRVALVDPPLSGPGRRGYPAKLDWYLDSIALARRGASIEDMRPYVPTWSDEQIRLRTEWLPTCDEAAVTASWHGLHEDDIHQDIPFLTMPTLLIGAERGDVITEGDVAEILDLNNKIRFTRVAAAGHMIPWDNFEGFFSALMPFLGEEPVRPVR